MVILRDVKFGANGVPSHVLFDAPLGYRVRFLPGSEGGWVSLSDQFAVSSLMCFRSTPGAQIDPVINGEGFRSFLASVCDSSSVVERVVDMGYGKAIVPTRFDENLMNTRVTDITQEGVAIFDIIDEVENEVSLADTQTMSALDNLGSLRRKTSTARSKQDKNIKNAWGGTTILHALRNFPRAYRDVTFSGNRLSLDREGQEEIAKLTYQSHNESTLPAKFTRLMQVQTLDEMGKRFNIALFGESATEARKWLRMMRKGENLIAFGRIKEYQGKPSLSTTWIYPEELLSETMLPIYRSKTKGIQAMENRLITRASIAPIVKRLSDPLPQWVTSQHKLPSRSQAYTHIHTPSSRATQFSARTRIVWDEFLWLCSRIDRTRNHANTAHMVLTDEGCKRINIQKNSYPYPLSTGQLQAINEITDDMRSGVAMRRLVQGDVGCGKTTVAGCVASGVIAQGGQVAILAPTSVLARQLAHEMKLVSDSVVLINGAVTTVANRDKIKKVASGQASIVVGTHSILSESMRWKDLALVIVDEQQKFGRGQREKLIGNNPGIHFLMMSATPIPSAIASTIYGDLAISRIDVLPNGRKPISTSFIEESGESVVSNNSHPLWQKVETTIKRGEKVYIINTLVDESLDRASVESTFNTLSARFPMRVELLHGKMSVKEKDQAIKRFKNGETPILVSSSVVEVGVSVPDATLIIILDAVRFGLSSLHQMRGRVGRGNLASECVLVSELSQSDPESSKRRMSAMVENTSGFTIAEIDFDMRQEGQYYGEAQSGRSDLGVASIKRDKAIFDEVSAIFPLLDDATKNALYEESLIIHPPNELEE